VSSLVEVLGRINRLPKLPTLKIAKIAELSFFRNRWNLSFFRTIWLTWFSKHLPRFSILAILAVLAI